MVSAVILAFPNGVAGLVSEVLTEASVGKIQLLNPPLMYPEAQVYELMIKVPKLAEVPADYKRQVAN